MFKKLVLLWCLLFTGLCWGQFTMVPHYNASTLPTFTPVDNTANCQVGHNNCWHQMPGQLVSVTVGMDGTIGGVNSVGQAYIFATDYPTHNDWVYQSAMGTMYQLAIGNASLIYNLNGSCGSGYYYIHKWVNNAWQTLPGCLSKLSVAGGIDQLAGINSCCGTAYISTNDGTNWTQLPAPPNGGTWIDVAQTDFATYLLASTGYVYSYSNGVFITIGGANSGVKIAANNLGNVYVIGTTSNGQTVWKFITNGWVAFAQPGVMTAIATAGPMTTVAVGPNGYIYRLAEFGLTASMSVNGYTDCSGNLQCKNAYHTPHAQITFASKHTGGANTYGLRGYAPNQITATGTDTIYDPFDCFEGLSSCAINWNVGIDCSIKGPNFFYTGGSGSPGPGSGLQLDSEWAYTKFKNTGAPPLSCSTLPMTKIQICDYEVTSWCSNTATPDFDKPFIGDAEAGPYWYSLGYCTRPVTIQFSLPWACTSIVDVATSNPTFAVCTVHP